MGFQGYIKGGLLRNFEGVLQGVFNNRVFKGDLKIDMEGDSNGDFREDFTMNFTQELERTCCQAQVRTGPVQVWPR